MVGVPMTLTVTERMTVFKCVGYFILIIV